MRAYFDEMAGKFGRQYVPGRSWKGLAETLLALMPPLEIADLGAGEGTFSQLLARRAKSVIAVDNSQKMVEYGAELARKHGVLNLEYRQGDLEAVPIPDQTIDLAFSQSGFSCIMPCILNERWRKLYRILKPGGRIHVVLDLVRHTYMKTRAKCMPICGSDFLRSRCAAIFGTGGGSPPSRRQWCIVRKRPPTSRRC